MSVWTHIALCVLPLAVPNLIHEDANPDTIHVSLEPNLPPELVGLWILLLE